MTARSIAILIIVLALGVGIGYFSAGRDSTVIAEIPEPVTETPVVTESAPTETFAPAASASPENAVRFECNADESLIAVFARDIVGITLDDQRQFTLRETASETGVRYEDAYNKIVFTGEGETAYLMEKGEVTHSNCRVRE